MSRRFASLTSRLVLTAVLLVLAVSTLLAVTTTLALRANLADQLDGEVRAALDRARGGLIIRGYPQVTPPVGEQLFDEPPPDVRGQGAGTLSAYFSRDGSESFGDVLTDDGGRRELNSAQLDVLARVADDGEVHRIDLGDLGAYRVAADDGGEAATVVAGLPTEDVDDSVASLVRIETGLVLLAVLLAALAGRAVVRRQLRPLHEVAETAHTVAARPLDRGSIGVTERVPARLTDEATEVGQVGAALNTLLAHVETSLDAREASEQRVRQFVADASHELRTPLTTIAGYTELARRRPDDPATAATALTKVADESGRMTALVEDLLLLARLDSGRPLERRPVDLTRLLLEAVSDARVLAPDHRWRLALPDEAIEVTGDADRLRQVVTNLLTNARKYTPAGTTVTVTARNGGFTVHDEGPGFPPELVPRAFERFARADTSRHREGGVGLGLALVEAIVTAHGGAVVLASTPGDTRVEVRLAGSGPEV